MQYKSIENAVFLERPNRFIAYVELNGKREKVHVKNTGRCRELLQEGTEVYLEKSDNPARTTAYDLVAVKKGDRVVNMDSAAPNAAAGEWLRQGGLHADTQQVKAEVRFGKSRFDFWVRTEQKECWVEVKGVNLEKENVALFPDAPSERALKHVEELIAAAQQGYEAVLLFVVQMTGICRFEPNRETQPEFADALVRAKAAGVQILAKGCEVHPDRMVISYDIPVMLDEEEQSIAPLLLNWYDCNRRILPWREEPSPYRVWVSEIMLQQTRVEAVKPYFERFIARFPDISSLAKAPEEELLKLWEGLGYYNRVRNMKKAALEVMEHFGGEMPRRPEELLQLTGIGSYTAGAVASIANGIAVPAVDGNVLRVLARYRGDARDMANLKVRNSVEEYVQEQIPADRPGDFNQALMEIGAMVCLPNGTPKCENCPLHENCQAFRLGKQLEFPMKAAKAKRTVEAKTILLIQDGKKTAIRKRPDKGLLAGMYEFPSLEGKKTAEEVLNFLKDKGLDVIRIQELPAAKHIFTHKEWHMTGFAVRVDELKPFQGEWNGIFFADKEESEEKYPIPSAFSAFTKYLKIRLGNEKYEK